MVEKSNNQFLRVSMPYTEVRIRRIPAKRTQGNRCIEITAHEEDRDLHAANMVYMQFSDGGELQELLTLYNKADSDIYTRKENDIFIHRKLTAKGYQEMGIIKASDIPPLPIVGLRRIQRAFLTHSLIFPSTLSTNSLPITRITFH